MKATSNVQGLFGIQPSGNIHIGNIKSIRKAIENDSMFLVADLHSRTSIMKKSNIFDSHKTICQLIALSVPHTSIYLQSNIKQLGDLLLYFNYFVKLPQLTRMHLYKRLEDIKETMYLSELCYPVLMLIDILISDSNTIFIGEDQIQHIELYNDFVSSIRFGSRVQYDASSCINGIDGRKMSKSYNNTISPFASESVIRKNIMSIKTESIALYTHKERESTLFDIERCALGDQLGEYLYKRKNLYRLSFLEEKKLFLHFFLQRSKAIKARYCQAKKEFSFSQNSFTYEKAQQNCYKYINKIKLLLRI